MVAPRPQGRGRGRVRYRLLDRVDRLGSVQFRRLEHVARARYFGGRGQRGVGAGSSALASGRGAGLERAGGDIPGRYSGRHCGCPVGGPTAAVPGGRGGGGSGGRGALGARCVASGEGASVWVVVRAGGRELCRARGLGSTDPGPSGPYWLATRASRTGGSGTGPAARRGQGPGASPHRPRNARRTGSPAFAAGHLPRERWSTARTPRPSSSQWRPA